jgi:small subunit ribosomal protein S17
MAKSFVGTVSSSAADKTIVVTVNSSKTHPLYRKQYTVSKKFMAHDEQNEAGVGDRVSIVEVKPISKRKRFLLGSVIEKAPVQHVEAEVPQEIAEVVAPVVEKKAAKKAEGASDAPKKAEPKDSTESKEKAPEKESKE